MSAQVAAAPICGFDIGTENCYIGVARAGGIEIILNDYSQRSTPGYVCLQEKKRELGVTAKQKQNTNISATFYNLRRLIGRQYHEVSASESIPFPIEEGENGEVAVRVFMHNEEHQLTATQLLAMVLTKLKQLSNNALECVINCPSYFTDSQRRELKNAATIASLNTLRILPDLSAVALYYCFYRVSSKEENNQCLAFIDIGASSTQCSIIQFDPKKNIIQTLAVECESNLGGRNFDQAIGDYFVEQHKLNLNKRSRIRLLAECEKLKKQMSASSNDLPINIECLHEDRDFSSKMCRETFEGLCTGYLERIGVVLQRALETASIKYAQLQKTDGDKVVDLKLNAVEIVGGSSRIPAIKRIVKDVFGIDPTSTLNADEATALGCTLQSAFLSPSFKVVRKLKIVDYQPYQINAQYYHESRPDIKTYTMEPFFEKGSAVPFAKQIILNCHALPIIFEFDYINETNQSTSIGQFRIFSTENLEFPPSKMKVRVRLDDNGLIQLASAFLELEDDSPAVEEPQPEAEGEQTAEQKEAKPAKKKVKNVELNHEIVWLRGYLNDAQLDKLRNFESQMVLADKNLNERIDSRNALEEYIYEWRDKIENEDYKRFIDSQSRDQFANELRDNERWLMEDEDSGEIQSKTIYQERLNGLKMKYSESILFRIREAENREPFLEKLGKTIQMGDKLLQQEEPVEDLDKLRDQLVGAQQWFDETHSKCMNLDLTQNPPVLVSSIQSKIDELNSSYKQIYERINKLRQAREEEAKKKKQEQEKMETEANGKQNGSDATVEEPKDMDVDN